MRFPRPVDSTLHGVVDYTVGASLVSFAPRALGVSGTPAARQIRASGAIHAAYSALTNYPLGIKKAIPYNAHLALDAAGAVALAAAPFVTGQWKRGPRQWVPNVALALFEFSSLVISDPSGKGDFHGDVEAVRSANGRDPRRQIREGGLAVRPPADADAGSAEPAPTLA